jgi:hypothetical protein
MLKEQTARHWEAWVDQPVPALGNITPREAARTPLGRERLEALLADFASHEETMPAAGHVDVRMLRGKLGL